MIKKLAFTMYPISDVSRARRFYEETLGLTPGLAGGREGMWWIEYDLPGGGCLAITNTSGATPGGATVALEVEDLDRLMADLKQKEVPFKSDVIHGPNCRMAVCVDSEGNQLLLHQLNAKAEVASSKPMKPKAAPRTAAKPTKKSSARKAETPARKVPTRKAEKPLKKAARGKPRRGGPAPTKPATRSRKPTKR